MTKEQQLQEMEKSKKCNACVHNAVCQELEEFRDPLGWISTEGEFVCSYYEANCRKQSEGEWKPIKQYSERWGVEIINHYHCSVCDNLQYTDSANYCPNCGAKMKGGNE